MTLRTILQISLLFLGFSMLLAYAVFQARFLIIGPEIHLSGEPANQLLNERVITLEGNARNISRIWLNDRPIFTDTKGNFKEAIVLQNGYTIATLRAQDRYGRITSLHRSYIYRPASFIQ
jgi:hypothetical protein